MCTEILPQKLSFLARLLVSPTGLRSVVLSGSSVAYSAAVGDIIDGRTVWTLDFALICRRPRPAITAATIAARIAPITTPAAESSASEVAGDGDAADCAPPPTTMRSTRANVDSVV